MTHAISDTAEPTRWARPPPRDDSTGAGRNASFDADLVALVPSLRLRARSLCGNWALADDLVQEACESAMASSQSFMPSSNMGAWLFTILRNKFYSQMRKRRREVEDTDGSYAGSLVALPVQDSAVDLRDASEALGKLRRAQREALLLIGQLGFTYGEAASKSGCAVGTIKSRAHRGRLNLAALLN